MSEELKRKSDLSWVDTTLQQMSLEEKVGQMLQIRIYADYENLQDPDFQLVVRQMQQYHLGSVDLGARMRGPNLAKGTPLQVATTVNELQRNATIPLLVASDIERGLASRVSEVPDFPSAMAFGAIGEEGVVRQFAQLTASEARAIGIQWAYAPVADVNRNSNNPIINTRSYGEDPETVSQLVAAYIHGAHNGDMIVSAKHFPGQGDTATDTHIGVAQVLADRNHLRQYEFAPFQSAIRAGADSIMLGHVAVPALDPDPRMIATISPQIVTGVLRGELGFRGIVVTDALEMRSVLRLYPSGVDPSARAAVDAIKAGADVIMLPKDVGAAFHAIVNAVRDGEISKERIDNSVRKILEMKAKAKLDRGRFVGLEQVEDVFGDNAAKEFAQAVSDKSVTLLKDNGRILPVPRLRSYYSLGQNNDVTVLIWSDSAHSRLGHEFESQVRIRRPDAKLLHYYNDHVGSDAPDEILSKVKSADEVIAAIFETSIPGRQLFTKGRIANTIGLNGDNMAFVKKILGLNPAKTVVIAFGSPYLIADNQVVENYICTYSLAATAEISAAKAIFGELTNNAKLPVSISSDLPRGSFKPWRTTRVALQ